MEGSTETVKSWLRCYRCWSQNLEVQVHYEGIHRIDPATGLAVESFEVPDEDVSWTGLEFDANHLYLIGSQSNQGVLYRLARP